MDRHVLRTVLRLDAAANAAAGLALLAAGGWLAPHVGLGTSWPLRLAGALLVVYGSENLLVARRPTRAGLTGLVAVDVGFAVAVLAFVVADPTAAAAWVRGVLVAVAGASLAFGVAKSAARRTLSPLASRGGHR